MTCSLVFFCFWKSKSDVIFQGSIMAVHKILALVVDVQLISLKPARESLLQSV